jgi:AraC family transcriptional regulator, alkane utilization regulator
MDALSDVLNLVRLEGAIFLNAEFTAPWCIWSKFGLASVNERLGRAEHVMFFHFLVEGSHCSLRMAGSSEVLAVAPGDLVLFPKDARHLLGSDLLTTPVESANLPADDVTGGDVFDADVIQMRHGGGGAASRFVCGYVACRRSVSRPLLDALPPVLRIPMQDAAAATLLRELFRAGVRESASGQPGADSMLAKLSELMFVEALRRHVAAMPPDGKGWLAGVSDAKIGRALSVLHSDPERAWTVDELAREVAMSRSGFAERFSALVGDSPMQYLLRWRLALAANALRSTGEAIVAVADRSGYESVAAFSRAFKREFGMPPAAWRKAAANAYDESPVATA